MALMHESEPKRAVVLEPSTAVDVVPLDGG
jgi:hypothetical protein